MALPSLIILLLLSTLGFTPAQSSAPTGRLGSEIQFQPVGTSAGWALTGSQLYWSEDNGASWTPTALPAAPDAKILSLNFNESGAGWLLTSAPNGALTLATRGDAAAAWQTSSLTPSNPPASLPQEAHLTWFDDQTGILLLHYASSANFSLALLFKTTDGGASWQDLSAPAWGDLAFQDDRHLWLAGGAGASHLYRSADGGASWQEAILDIPGAGQTPRRVYAPLFSDFDHGILPLETVSSNSRQLSLLKSSDGGQSWQNGENYPLNPAAGALTLLSENESLRVILPEQKSLLSANAEGASLEPLADPMLAGLVSLRASAAQPDVLWGLVNQSNCAAQSGGDLTCSQDLSLVRSADGGKNWLAMQFPGGSGTHFSSSQSVPRATLSPMLSPSGLTQSLVGQGFDICEIPSLAQLQKWKSNSPYAAINLYIGGRARACPNTALSADYIHQIASQGWKFIPTWVGPQSSCGSFSAKFSLDLNTAYRQGVNEANLALAQLAAYGLANSSGGDALVYYDLEAYNTGNSACRAAARAFIDGWSAQLHPLGGVSGVYGSPCSSALPDFAALSNVPDAVWPAAWYHNAGGGGYDPNATVWGLPCMADSFWNNHQRIRQYEGDHNETWGNLTLNIDNDVIDGLVTGSSGSLPVCPALSDRVRLFSGANCSATSLDAGVGLVQLNNLNFDNLTQALAIPAGWSARLYENASETLAESLCLAASDPTLADNVYANGDSALSSATWMRVYTSPDCSGSNAVNPPGVFTKLSPAKAAGSAARSPLLTWGASNGAARYEYCIDSVNDNACNTSWISTGTATSVQLYNLALTKTYYWQVRAVNDGGTSYANGSSPAFWSFTTQSNNLPDLKITAVTTSPSDSNEPAKVVVSVSNQTAYAAGGFWIDIYINRSPTGCGDDGNYWVWAGSLAAGATSKWTVKIPAQTLTPGSYNIRAYADINCLLAESNESNNAFGPVSQTINAPSAPPSANDDFSGRTKLPSFFSQSLNVSGDTRASDDPPLKGCQRNPGIRSAWYSYRSSSARSVSIDTIGSSYDTMIGVWTGSRGSLSEVTCNDDISNTNLQSKVKFLAKAGVTYSIEVSRWDGTLVSTTADVKSIGLNLSQAIDKPEPTDLTIETVDSLSLHFAARLLPKLTFYSNGSLDGWILETSENSSLGGSKTSPGAYLRVGDSAQNAQYRSILAFDSSSLPDNAQVQSAILKLDQAGFLGGNPFNSLQKLTADIRRNYFGSLNALESVDFQAPASLAGAVLFPSTPLNNWYSVGVNKAGLAYINKTGWTQFRLRFSLDDNQNFANDAVLFFSGDNSTVSLRPTLVVEYYLP